MIKKIQAFQGGWNFRRWCRVTRSFASSVGRSRKMGIPDSGALWLSVAMKKCEEFRFLITNSGCCWCPKLDWVYMILYDSILLSQKFKYVMIHGFPLEIWDVQCNVCHKIIPSHKCGYTNHNRFFHKHHTLQKYDASLKRNFTRFSGGGTCLFFLYWYGSRPINTIFRGMNIHLPAILGFTRYQGSDPSPYHGYFFPSSPKGDPGFTPQWSMASSAYALFLLGGHRFTAVFDAVCVQNIHDCCYPLVNIQKTIENGHL